MRVSNRIVATMLALITLVSLNAQNFTTPLNQGYWSIGLNAGSAYQSSDVQSLNGFGTSLTVGKNIFHRPSGVVDFGVQGRLAYMKSFGLNPYKSFNIENNRAVNGTNGLDYTTFPKETLVDQGFVYANHKTQMAEAGLEGVVTLNELKEKTGVTVKLFGGLGANAYYVETDQADANGNEYHKKYADLNDREPTSLIKKNLKGAILDGVYESDADGFEYGGKVGFMPSVGAEIGFQVTPKFSIDLGHRTTFSGTNQLDGEQWADSKNDIQHYTYGGLTFNFNKREKVYRAPNIIIVEPRNATSTYHERVSLFAKVENVENATDIDLLVNGERKPFHFRKEKMTSDIFLERGENQIEIIASNFGGEDRRSLTIFREKAKVIITPPPPPRVDPAPVVYAPVVDIVEPLYNDVRIRDSRLKVIAVVKNIVAKRDIVMYVNGRAHNFNFNPHRGEVEAIVDLLPGENEILIRAFNEAGQTEDRFIAFFEERIPIHRPRVRITQPAKSFTANRRNIKIVAETKFVLDRRDVLVTMNNRKVRGFEFGNDRISTFVDLEEGRNIVRVRVENPTAVVEDEIIIFYNEVRNNQPAPRVNFISPNDQETIARKEVEIEVEVLNMKRRNDIELTVNNKVTDFEFRNERLTATVDLRNGSNTIKVKATNRVGSDAQVLVVHHKKRVEPIQRLPKIEITAPANNSTTEKDKVELVANITHANKAEVTVNGKAKQVVDVIDGQISTFVELRKGTNIIKVKATNKKGTEDEVTKVTLKKKAIVNAPTIKITAPRKGANPKNSLVKLVADVKGVATSKNIEVFLNGKRVRSIDFKNEELKAVMSLDYGTSKIKIKATNAGGTTIKETTIVRKKEIKAVAPTVTKEKLPDVKDKIDSEKEKLKTPNGGKPSKLSKMRGRG